MTDKNRKNAEKLFESLTLEKAEESELKEKLQELEQAKEEISHKIVQKRDEENEESDYPWGGQKQKREYIQFMTWMKSEFYQKYGDALTERDNLAIEMFWNYMKQEHMQSSFVPETMDSNNEEEN